MSDKTTVLNLINLLLIRIYLQNLEKIYEILQIIDNKG